MTHMVQEVKIRGRELLQKPGRRKCNRQFGSPTDSTTDGILTRVVNKAGILSSLGQQRASWFTSPATIQTNAFELYLRRNAEKRQNEIQHAQPQIIRCPAVDSRIQRTAAWAGVFDGAFHPFKARFSTLARSRNRL
jgi:hypothetical protein